MWSQFPISETRVGEEGEEGGREGRESKVNPLLVYKSLPIIPDKPVTHSSKSVFALACSEGRGGKRRIGRSQPDSWHVFPILGKFNHLKNIYQALSLIRKTWRRIRRVIVSKLEMSEILMMSEDKPHRRPTDTLPGPQMFRGIFFISPQSSVLSSHNSSVASRPPTKLIMKEEEEMEGRLLQQICQTGVLMQTSSHNRGGTEEYLTSLCFNILTLVPPLHKYLPSSKISKLISSAPGNASGWAVPTLWKC